MAQEYFLKKVNGIPADSSGNVVVDGGGGLEGTSYVFVQANGTDIENAIELQTAYNLAKTKSPSITNRIIVIAAPGNYNFTTNDFIMNTVYIDLISLDGNKSIVFNGVKTINITANDVFIKGINVLEKSFTIADDLNLLKIENCQGGDDSFGGGYGDSASGTFIDCQGGVNSFGDSASGTFTNCIGGDGSFGGDGGVASGTFTNCIGGDGSFGGDGGVASGTFTNCIGGEYSFGSSSASGTFTNCQGGSFSFGSTNKLKGKLYYCRLTSGTFKTVTAPGRTIYCIDGNNLPNNQ
jgi:hypothetical protein